MRTTTWAVLWGLGDPAGIDYIRTSLAMAIEHNIPDEAGRAYVNQSGQGIALQPLPYAEAEALVDEAVGYAQRTQPGGVYDGWLQTARGEFLFFAARWDEAHRQFQELAARSRVDRYIQINIIAFRALLAALRSQPESAAELVSPVVEPGREESAQRFDEAHRFFDAARMRLWLAEEQGDPRLLGDARSVFERLGAAGYLRRAERLTARIHGPA